MYIFKFPSSLMAVDKNKLIYVDEVERKASSVDEAKEVMAALLKKNIPFVIQDEQENRVSVEAIIPEREFWQYYFEEMTDKKATEILLR